jgi:hypothetical protein
MWPHDWPAHYGRRGYPYAPYGYRAWWHDAPRWAPWAGGWWHNPWWHDHPYGGYYPYYMPHAVGLLLSLAHQARELPSQPPVTLATAALLCGLHFRALFLSAPLAAALGAQHDLVHAACLQPVALLRGRGVAARLGGWALLHVDEAHVFYNVASFLEKGAKLEPRLGSRAFAELLVRLALGGALIHVALAALLARRLRRPGARTSARARARA